MDDLLFIVVSFVFALFVANMSFWISPDDFPSVIYTSVSLFILIFFGYVKIKLMIWLGPPSQPEFMKYNEDVKPVAMFVGGDLLICPGCDDYVDKNSAECEKCGCKKK